MPIARSWSRRTSTAAPSRRRPRSWPSRSAPRSRACTTPCAHSARHWPSEGWCSMSTDASRRNVGAYVLGILDADEMTTFEAHLADCDTCAAEVERLLPAALALGEVSPNQAIALHMIHDESGGAELP